MSSAKIGTLEAAAPPLPLKSTPWRSIYIGGALTLCQAVQFALYLSPLWPYLQLLDPSITENFYGYIIAAYSLGQCVSAPVVGYWSTKIRSVVLPIQLVLGSVLAGNLVYFLAALLPSGRKYAVLLARFLVGVGGANMAMLNTYASMASLPKDRSKSVAIVTGGVSVGMCLGPALQLLFTPIGSHGWRISGDLKLNMYTTPALACCVVNICAMLLLQFCFVEEYAGVPNANKKTDEPKAFVPKYDWIAVCLCHFTRFTQLFTWTNLETIGAPFAMAMFAMSREDAVQYFALSHLGLGFLSLSVYALFIVVKMQKYFDFRLVCITGLVGFVFFHVATFSWPFVSGHVHSYSAEEYSLYLNGTIEEEPVGCPKDRFDWCETIAPVNVWVYFVVFVLTMGFCWAQINVSLSTILSNVLGPRQQANQQSLFYAVGSSARLTGPIFISRLYSSWGPRYAWILEVVVISLTLLLWAVFYRRMVPLVLPEENVEKKPVESESDDEFDRASRIDSM